MDWRRGKKPTWKEKCNWYFPCQLFCLVVINCHNQLWYNKQTNKQNSKMKVCSHNFRFLESFVINKFDFLLLSSDFPARLCNPIIKSSAWSSLFIPRNYCAPLVQIELISVVELQLLLLLLLVRVIGEDINFELSTFFPKSDPCSCPFIDISI